MIVCKKCGTPVGCESRPGGFSIAVCSVCDGEVEAIVEHWVGQDPKPKVEKRNPRKTLRKLSFPYLGLPLVETATDSGYYWDSIERCVIAIKNYGLDEHGKPNLNPIAFISAEALDKGGLESFIEWEAKLWV